MPSVEEISNRLTGTIGQLPDEELAQAFIALESGAERLSAAAGESSGVEIRTVVEVLGDARDKLAAAIGSVTTAREEITAYNIAIGGDRQDQAVAAVPVSDLTAASRAGQAVPAYRPPVYFVGGEQGVDKTPGRIYAMLGDVVWGRVADDLLTEAAHTNARRIRANDSEQARRPLEDVQREAMDGVRYTLLATPGMTELRARATELYERYAKAEPKGYEAADTYFYNRASDLCDAARRYAEAYFDPDAGVEKDFDLRAMTPADTVRLMMQSVPEKGSGRSGAVRRYHHFRFAVPEAIKHSRDDIFIEVADGHVEEITFDTFRFFTSPEVLSWGFLAAAAKGGAELTPAQKQVLIQKGLLQQWAGRRRGTSKEAEELVRAVAESPLLTEAGQSDLIGAMYLFAATLPPDLAQMVGGRNRRWVASNREPVRIGGVEVQVRDHDYDHYETAIRMDTRGWRSEDIERLLEHYTYVLKSFPRVPEPKTRSYKRFMEGVWRKRRAPGYIPGDGFNADELL